MRCAFQQRNTGTVFQYFQRSTDRGLAEAEQRGDGQLIPVHDVVQVVRMALSLSSASFVKELTLPALLDERF